MDVLLLPARVVHVPQMDEVPVAPGRGGELAPHLLPHLDRGRGRKAASGRSTTPASAPPSATARWSDARCCASASSACASLYSSSVRAGCSSWWSRSRWLRRKSASRTSLTLCIAVDDARH